MSDCVPMTQQPDLELKDVQGCLQALILSSDDSPNRARTLIHFESGLLYFRHFKDL